MDKAMFLYYVICVHKCQDLC